MTKLNITEDDIKAAALWAENRCGELLPDAPSYATAVAVIHEAFKKLIPRPVFPTLTQSVQTWINGWVAGVALTDVETSALVCDATFLDEIEPHVDCDCSKGESEKARLMEEVRVMIREERGEPIPKKADEPQVVKVSKMDTTWVNHVDVLVKKKALIVREQLERHWLEQSELTPEECGRIIADVQSTAPQGLVYSKTIQQEWADKVNRARRTLTATSTGKALLSHINEYTNL